MRIACDQTPRDVAMALRIGTCGWQYDDWRDAFYPHDLAKPKWLAAYAETFDTVERDNAFYRLLQQRSGCGGYSQREKPATHGKSLGCKGFVVRAI